MPSWIDLSPPYFDELQVPPVSRGLPQAATAMSLCLLSGKRIRNWFIQVEAKFRMDKIAENRKYDLLVDALPPEATMQVREDFVAPYPEIPLRQA